MTRLSSKNRCKTSAPSDFSWTCISFIFAATLSALTSRAQQPATAPVTQPSSLASQLQSRHQALNNARSDLVAASLLWPKNDLEIAAKARAVEDAELAFAQSLSLAVAQKQQALATKASAEHARRIPNIPNLTDAQSAALTQMAGPTNLPMLALTKAREAVTGLALSESPENSALKAAIKNVAEKELDLANIRANAFAKLQSCKDKLAPEQIAAFAAMGGIMKTGGFSEPKPIDFNDHEGYVSLFDGTTLKGWDGNPKIWRVENGNIIGESTPENPSGNSYLVYRGTEAKDFTLKFEIKIADNGGSGMQYRSKTGIPWLAPVADNVRPVNLNWMMTGPQADFWPSQIYSGQFYSENTPLRIVAWRGQVVESNGLIGPRRLMGNIGDRKALGTFENKTDWNQYTVIARGGTFLHIMNGQLMSALVDDDPDSSNNQSGFIGIEIESITKLYVRNVWLKKIN
jgi:hypothetical protein